MMSISLGPLALPTAPLMLLLATLLAAWLADRVAPAAGMPGAAHGDARPAGTSIVHAVLAALIAARLAHVGLHLGAYLAEPWNMLDVRDGGFSALAGLVAGTGWLAWQALRHAPLRKALAAGAAAGLLLWSAGTAGLGALAPRDLPDLELTDLATGQPVRLRAVAAGGKPVVLNLWATWCGPCRREMPVLAAAQARHPGVTFIFANQGESAETVRRYLDKEQLALAGLLLDPRAALGPALGSAGLPTTVFLDRDGRRVDAHMGELNRAALESRVAAISKP